MSTQYVEYSPVPAARTFSWSGIFAGTFLFLAIETTFGFLGVAIFGRAAAPQAHTSMVPSIGAGIGIWMVILSIIALYFSGKLASRISGAFNRNAGMYAGLITYGMCVFTSVFVAALMLGSPVGGDAAMVAAGPTRVADFIITGGYWLFAGAILGMISAASGGVHGAWNTDKRQPPIEQTTTATGPRKAA